MQNTIIKLSEKHRNSFGFNEEVLITSTKKHKSFDTLLESSEKSSMMESVKTIPIESITQIEFNEKDDTIEIDYINKKGKSKTDIIELTEPEYRIDIAEDIASIKGFNKTVSSESKTTPLLTNIAALGLIGGATWYLKGIASAADQGEHYVATGRKRGIMQLVANAAEFIGPIGISVIGVLGLGYMGYVTYKRFSNPASEVVFK